MLGRILKTAANEFLRHRRRETGRGPGRLPPTSGAELRGRLTQGVVRAILSRFFRR